MLFALVILSIAVVGLLAGYLAERSVRLETQDDLFDFQRRTANKSLQIIALEEERDELQAINDENLANFIAAIQQVDAEYQASTAELEERCESYAAELERMERQLACSIETKSSDERRMSQYRASVFFRDLSISGLKDQVAKLQKKIADLTEVKAYNTGLAIYRAPDSSVVTDVEVTKVTDDKPAKKKAAKKKAAKKAAKKARRR